jgi:hypothetical protein
MTGRLIVTRGYTHLIATGMIFLNITFINIFFWYVVFVFEYLINRKDKEKVGLFFS